MMVAAPVAIVAAGVSAARKDGVWVWGRRTVSQVVVLLVGTGIVLSVFAIVLFVVIGAGTMLEEIANTPIDH